MDEIAKFIILDGKSEFIILSRIWMKNWHWPIDVSENSLTKFWTKLVIYSGRKMTFWTGCLFSPDAWWQWCEMI